MYDWFNKTKSKFVESDFIKYYINFDRQMLLKRIEIRTNQMIKLGVLKELKKFNKLKIKKEHNINKVIGINELNKYLKKEISLDDAITLVIIRTRQYAKRQTTWARGKMSSWININPNQISLVIKKFIF